MNEKLLERGEHAGKSVVSPRFRRPS